MDNKKRIFISYSWDSEEHMEWVKKLANSIEVYEDVHVLWDGYDLDSCVDKNLFMEKSVAEADLTIIVATTKYSEKANNRSGGVGIETYLNTARHWYEMIENKKTNSIVVLRDKNSTPNYLKGHIHIDFTNDELYENKLSELFERIESKPRVERPQKITATRIKKKVYQLTKAEDIIGISAKNRKPIISLSEGTDFSGSNRIKFEFWETRTPAINHILAIHNNINIQQTLEKSADLILSKNLDIQTLIILRPKEKKKGTVSIDSIMERKKEGSFSGITLIETTYKDYVWEYCIDEDFKNVNAPDVIEFYTTQELKDEHVTHNSAVEKLIGMLSDDSESSAHLVIGGGGIGKTSLCLSLVNQLVHKLSSDSLTILIRSEDLRKYLEENELSSNKIESIYDIYELQAKYLKQANIFDKKTFELSIVSGSIVIAIDGLDELSSIFRGKFNIKLFLDSVSNLHAELGSSRILLTSRDDSLVSKEDLDEWNIQKYELLGFQIENCRKYLRKRFKSFSRSDLICEKIMKQVEGSLLVGNNRIVPFFIDVISNIFEENIDHQSDDISFSIGSSSTPYPSLNELVDQIIFSIFEREKTRHRFNIEPKEMLELFCLLNIECGEVWSLPSVQETLHLLYDQNGVELFKNIKQNPLLINRNSSLHFKYDFLHSYFNSLYLFEAFEKRSVDYDFVKLISKISTDSSEFKDLNKYFAHDIKLLIASSKVLIAEFKTKSFIDPGEGQVEHERYRSAIEAIISLVYSISKPNKDEFTSLVKNLYGMDNGSYIEGLYLKGDLPPFNFSDLKISQSKFRDYPKFLSSNFRNSEFMYCEFDSCHNDQLNNSEILEATIDKNTCVMGDLLNSFEKFSELSKIGERKLVDETQRFLSSFYKGSSFRDNNKIHIRFLNIPR